MAKTQEKVPVETGKSANVDFRTRNAQIKREKMLARLLSATMEVCAGTNRRGTAVIDDVVRAAGVSRGAFYWYFDSLDQAIEMLGRKLADDIAAETRQLFNGEAHRMIGPAIGGQMMFCRARMDPVWAGFLSNVHILLDDSSFVTAVRRNLEVGRDEGWFHFDSLRIAVDFQLGGVLAGIRRCTVDPPASMAELTEMNRLILIGLGMKADRAAQIAGEAKEIVCAAGPHGLSWWRALD